MERSDASESTASKRFAAGRYETREEIGRGGAAVVYRARDLASDRDVALKQLTVPAGSKHRADALALFEREFRTLAELSHPSIIKVYDYGVEDGSAFYTMELVLGSDLRERAPLPWREACGLIAEVCSSLSLVHARGLVHRDISPRNVRCTLDGRARLIDFGAMAPMGTSTIIAGTPAFVAPEVVYRSALDARTDLFSLGATLYFTLAGRAAYPARDFSQLVQLWRMPPELPSRIRDDIPEALDALVMSLLSLEPALRPRSAAEVMQRLLAISGATRREAPDVSRAYLLAPSVVGRGSELSAIRADMAAAFAGAGRSVLIHAASGLGRSRMLDACVLEAKTSGATVLRSRTASKERRAFAVADELAAQLLELLPDASAPGAFALELAGQEKSNALSRWILLVARTHPIAIVIDDVEHIDDDSGRLLAKLVSQALGARLLVLATAEDSALKSDDMIFAALVARSRACALGPLSRGAVAELFGSVFGDVPNLGLISDGIFAVSGGNPRLSMSLAQCLVDKKKISYEAGVWTLPSSLEALELPTSAEETLRQQLNALSGLATRLVEAQALASHEAFSREDYARLSPASSSAELDRALLELLERQVLTSDGHLYLLSHRGWTATVSASRDAETLRQRHQELAQLYDQNRTIACVHHMFAGGLIEPGLQRLQISVKGVETVRPGDDGTELLGAQMASVLERGLEAAIELGRPAFDVNVLRRALVSFSALITEEEIYYRGAPAWLEQLERDTGYAHWAADPERGDPGARLTRALQHALDTYAATPERDRVYPVDEAIRCLVIFVVVSIAIAARTQDFALIDRLPSLLEPFVPLSRVVAAIHKNALAGRELRVMCRPERARAFWIEAYEQLKEISEKELPPLELIRNAVASGIATAELTMGLPSAEGWADSLEGDMFQAAHSLYLKRVVRLHEGDWERAEKLRKQAEERAIEARGRRMFTTSTVLELFAYGLAGDLVGVKEIVDRIEPFARRFPGWVPWNTFAEGELQRLRGDLTAAVALYEKSLGYGSGRTGTLASWWPPTAQGYMETLLELGQSEQVRTFGLACVQFCEAHEIHQQSFGIVRALALAEAKLGELTQASERLERVIDAQRALGVSGLELGASYEARARVAIWASDEPAIEEFGRLTAREYRHGRNSPLGARYERLLNEARRSAAKVLPQLTDFTSSVAPSGLHTLAPGRLQAAAIVDGVMDGATTPGERTQRALALLRTHRAASGGHLYVLEGTKLRLAASEDLPTPGPELLEWITRMVARESDEEETKVVEQMNDAAAHGDVYRDAEGVSHSAMLLRDSAGQLAALVILANVADESLAAHVIALQLAPYLKAAS